MTGKRNPSGLPQQRIVGPMWGPSEIDLDRRIGLRHDGLLRVRRSLLFAAGFVVALAAAAAAFGNFATAAGIGMLLLAPLALILVCLQLLVMATAPKKTRHS